MSGDRRKKYDEMREIKRASFHKVKDADILVHIKDKEFSTYVKKLIREKIKMKTIEQINRNDIGVHKSILNRVVVLSQYNIDDDKNTISIDMQGAAQLIKVLQGWIDEN